jgi:hypothetical protein
MGGRVIQQFDTEFPLNPIGQSGQMHNRVIVGLLNPFCLWAKCLLPLECGIQLKIVDIRLIMASCLLTEKAISGQLTEKVIRRKRDNKTDKLIY